MIVLLYHDLGGSAGATTSRGHTSSTLIGMGKIIIISIRINKRKHLFYVFSMAQNPRRFDVNKNKICFDLVSLMDKLTLVRLWPVLFSTVLVVAFNRGILGRALWHRTWWTPSGGRVPLRTLARYFHHWQSDTSDLNLFSHGRQVLCFSA